MHDPKAGLLRLFQWWQLPVVALAVAVATPAVSAQIRTDSIHGMLPPAIGETLPSMVSHTFEAQDGFSIEVRLIAVEEKFDPILELVSPRGERLENDDYGGTLNSRLVAQAVGDGTWEAVVRSWGRGGGPYLLIITSGPSQEEANFRGELTALDSITARGHRYRVHTVDLDDLSSRRIVLSAQGFEGRLVLFRPSGERLENLDFSTGPASVVDLPEPETGRWRIAVAQRDAEDGLGCYTLRILRQEATASETRALLRVGTITSLDPRQLDGEHFHVHRFDTVEEQIVLDLVSEDFDAFMALRSPSGTWYRDDDGGEGNNSRITPEPEAGTWEVIISTFNPNETGTYRLLLTRDRRAAIALPKPPIPS